jgi:hypothetical protein
MPLMMWRISGSASSALRAREALEVQAVQQLLVDAALSSW